MDPRDPLRPTPALPAFDPAQLSFGDVAAVPQLRVDRQAGEGSGRGPDEMSSISYREPPVCGESSYDNLDDAGPSWSVRIVQEAESHPPASRGPAARPSSPAPASAPPARPMSQPVSRPMQRPNHRVAPPPRPAPMEAPPARPIPPRPSPMPAAMIAPMRPTPVAMPSLSLEPLKRATEMSPRDADAAIMYAHALDKHGNAAAALGALDECLANGGDEVRLICARAFLLGSRLKYELAEQELKRAAKIRADDPDVQLQSGILDCRRARWRLAVEPLQKAAVQRGDDALAQFYLGEALNHVDQLAGALVAYERAAQLDPSNWRAFKGVGIVLDRLGRPTDASVAYRQMREAQGR
ncbi:MAG: tetratricopeptide repeat protein [Gemmatimonadaceae bacterium]